MQFVVNDGVGCDGFSAWGGCISIVVPVLIPQ